MMRLCEIRLKGEHCRHNTIHDLQPSMCLHITLLLVISSDFYRAWTLLLPGYSSEVQTAQSTSWLEVLSETIICIFLVLSFEPLVLFL